MGSDTWVFECDDRLLCVDAGYSLTATELERILRDLYPQWDQVRKELMLTHGDTDHVGACDAFDRVYASGRTIDGFTFESMGIVNWREQNPFSFPYARIGSVLSSYRTPDLSRMVCLGEPTEDDVAIEMLRAAHEIGYDFYDTAEAYVGVKPDGSISYNEELVGKAIHDFRDEVVIATKMGVHHDKDNNLVLDSHPETIRASCEESLRKLGIDCIDLYYQHRIDPKVEPEIVAETFGELIREGKIRAWGISETTEEYLRRAHAVTPVTAIENRYSMMARWHESIFPTCIELGISYVAFSPMANGFLTGAYNPATKFEGKQDFREGMPQYTEEGYAKAKDLLDLLHAMADEKHCTMGQLSLAWMINKDPRIIPIPGTRKLERLRENFGAASVAITPEEIASIDARLDTMDFDVFGGHAAKTLSK